MLIKIGNHEFTEVWDNVLYKKLSAYPEINNWEMRNIIEFIDYERMYGRECPVECEDKVLLDKVNRGLTERERYRFTPRPELITECTACPIRKGCVTEFVCHTTSVENAAKILRSGKLLSALKARNVPVEQLISEKRNAANDPADYFEYIMLAWGNCQAGDRLVMERKLGRFPNDDDLSMHFTPGVRFYFRYDTLKTHPNAVFDGVLPMKIKDELVLSDWAYAIVIPTAHKDELEGIVPEELADKVVYIENDCRDIWEWSEKVYCLIEKMRKTEA